MRFYILRALLIKEVRRHVANRGGIALAGLLIVAALLLSVFNPTAVEGGVGTTGGELVGGVHHCYIEYHTKTNLVVALEKRMPPGLAAKVTFRERSPGSINTLISDSPGTGTIRIIENHSPSEWQVQFEVWHPPGEPAALMMYEQWLWRSVREYFQEHASVQLARMGAGTLRPLVPAPPGDELWAVYDSFQSLAADVRRLQSEAKTTTAATPLVPDMEIRRTGIGARPLEFRTAIATGIVVFALYFACCYLLPALNCEERERGVLLAQALSPASPAELVIAKFLFYPVLGMGLAAVLAGIYSPAVLNSLYFWLALLALASGFLGIGMTVSTLAKTQRGAFMGSMCYLLSISLLLFICSTNHIPYISNFAIEFHGPKIIHAAMTQNIESKHWNHLKAEIGLGAGWMILACWLFRRRGWQ